MLVKNIDNTFSYSAITAIYMIISIRIQIYSGTLKIIKNELYLFHFKRHSKANLYFYYTYIHP